jgi:hypothetical protein
MRLHVGVRVLAASLATAAIAAPTASAYPPHREAFGGGAIAPTRAHSHPGSSDGSELIALSVLGGAGLVITGYGVRRRVVASGGAIQNAARA